MMSLRRFNGSKVFEINSVGVSKSFWFKKQMFSGFCRLSNVMLNSFVKSKKIVSCRCSNKTPQGLENSNGNTDLFDNSVEETNHNELENFKKLDGEEKPTVDLFEEISGGDPNLLKNLKMLEFEVAVLKEGGNKVPEKISKRHWQELLSLPSFSARKHHLVFLRKIELSNNSKAVKGKLKLEQKKKKVLEDGFFYYGLTGLTMFNRIYPKSIRQLLSLRQMAATHTIVFDCSYQNYMNTRNTRNCAKQIFLSLSEARVHAYPCKIDFCNFDSNNYLGQIFPSFVKNVEEHYGSGIYKESYLDIYPKEKLIYLSPHAPNELNEFRRDCIYIVGAFVDRGVTDKASFAKARENKIQMARFPLDYYLSWKSGSKSLPLNIVTNILLDMYFYNDWTKAFRHIPSRSFNDPSFRKWKVFDKSDLCF